MKLNLKNPAWKLYAAAGAVILIAAIVVVWTNVGPGSKTVTDTTVSPAAEKPVSDGMSNHVYRGENENWIAVYEINSRKSAISEDNVEDCRLSVMYKKDLADFSTVKDLRIAYESMFNAGMINYDFTEENVLPERTYVLRFGGTESVMKRDDETIKVTISVDGKIERLELQSLSKS